MNLLDKIKLIILQVLEDKSKINDFNINQNQVYAFTNENIAGYLKEAEMDFSTKTLTICSGGDHLLNLGVKNVLDIDLVDVNPMTEFFTLGIKLSLVLAYSYEDFKNVINFLFKSKDYDLILERKILYGLLPFMDLKYKIFFRSVFDYYFLLQEKYHVPIKLMQILTTDYYFNLDEITFYNLYLQQENYYNNLKVNIEKMIVDFHLGNIFTIDYFNKYDLILCSNAIEHTYIPECDMTKLKSYFVRLKKALTDNGKILATYMYGFYDKTGNSYENYPIKGTNIICREVLKEELIYIDSYKKGQDAVLVLKK